MGEPTSEKTWKTEPISEEPKCDSEEDEEAMSFGEFIETVIRLRSHNHISVVDLVDLQKLVTSCQKQVNDQLERLEKGNATLEAELDFRVRDHPIMQLLCSHPHLRQRFA